MMAKTSKTSKPAQDKTAPERRRGLSEQQVDELELAGGVEGGMKAGSAGGPGSRAQQEPRNAGKPKRTANPS
jgi:hypothetical protein